MKCESAMPHPVRSSKIAPLKRNAWAFAAARILALLAACVAVIALASKLPAHRPPPFGIVDGEFQLTSHAGERIDSRSLTGSSYAVFFGFTHCPGACSASLMEMVELLRELGAPAERFKVYFITLDPERDTQSVLADFVSAFGPQIVGLTGSEEEVAAAARSFRADYRKAPSEDGGYVIDHSSLIYLVDANGRVADLMTFDLKRSVALAKLRTLLATSSVLIPFEFFGAPASSTGEAPKSQ